MMQRDDRDLYNPYLWIKIIELYLDLNKKIYRAAGYKCFDLMLALDSAHIMSQKNTTIEKLNEKLNFQPETFVETIRNLEKIGLVERNYEAMEQREIINLTSKGLKIMQYYYRKFFRILDEKSRV